MLRTLAVILSKIRFKLIILVLVVIVSGCASPEMKIAHNEALFNDLSCVKTFCYDSAKKDGLHGANKVMDEFAVHCMFSHIKLHQSASKNAGLLPKYVSTYIREYDNQRISECIQSAKEGLEEFCGNLTYEEAVLRDKLEELKKKNTNTNSLEMMRITMDLSEIESIIDFNCK